MADSVLIVDDDAALAEMLALQFEDEGHGVRTAATCAEGLELARTGCPDVVILDQHLPDGRGVELLEPLLAEDPDLPIIMMTGVHDLELAIDAIQRGARDFVHKPVKTEALSHAVDKALEHRRLVRRVSALRAAPEAAPGAQGELIGRSDAMLRVSKEIALSARSDASVLLVGDRKSVV